MVFELDDALTVFDVTVADHHRNVFVEDIHNPLETLLVIQDIKVDLLLHPQKAFHNLCALPIELGYLALFDDYLHIVDPVGLLGLLGEAITRVFLFFLLFNGLVKFFVFLNLFVIS